jgi:hypothetical protein
MFMAELITKLVRRPQTAASTTRSQLASGTDRSSTLFNRTSRSTSTQSELVKNTCTADGGKTRKKWWSRFISEDEKSAVVPNAGIWKSTQFNHEVV